MEISKEFIHLIMDCELLGRCGIKDDLGFDIEYVESETKAEEMINSLKWENTCLEVSGDFTGFLSRNYKELYNKNWNVVVDQVKSEYMSEMNSKVEKNWKNEKSRQSILPDVQFNIITLFMLNFYSECYKSDFYNKMLAIYLSGHLPCGWIGEYPEGKFYVY